MRHDKRMAGGRSRSAPAGRGPQSESITLGLLLAGWRSSELVGPAVGELGNRLRRIYPSVSWRVAVRHERPRPALREVTELVDCGRRWLLAEGWNLAVVITDLPLRANRHPILSHASPTHAVGVISLPALGPVQTRRRVAGAALDVLALLLGEPARGRHDATPNGRRGWRPATLRRLRDLAAEPLGNQSGRFFALRALVAHARLLAGMVAANRPWRLAARLYRGLVAALAFVCFSVVSQGTWQLAVSMGMARLAIATLLSLAIMVGSLILIHHLWERAEHPAAREQVILFNAATALTLLIGVLTLYLALLAAAFLSAVLVVPAGVLGSALHHRAGAGEYLELAWLISSLATIGGALGAALESDSVVREATYAPHETTEEAAAVAGENPAEQGAARAPRDAQLTG